jgi:hypothetical protein
MEKAKDPDKKVRLGPTEKIILDHVSLKGPITSQQTGDNLYAKVSSAATEGTAKSGEVRRLWASKALTRLEKKGFVKSRALPGSWRGNPKKIWYIPGPKKCPECGGDLAPDSDYPDDLICDKCKKVFDAETLEFIEDF